MKQNRNINVLRNNLIFVSSLALFSLLAGYLLSAISFVGKVGIGLFYREYRFLKVWWKGTLLVFTAWIILYIIHSIFNKKLNRSKLMVANTVSLIIALAGLYFSYADFRNTLSHRWLGERFHLGVYLFWLGWIAIVIFSFRQQKPIEDTSIAT